MCDRVCVVRGALSRVLRASRLLGVTPLRFTPLRDGYSVSVSSLQLLYSYTCAILYTSIGFCAFFLDIQALIETMSFRIKLVTYPLWQLDIEMFVSSIVLIYYRTKSRMSNMIQSINIVEKIKVNIDENYSNSQDRKSAKMSIISIILLAPMVVADYNEYKSTRFEVKDILCYVIDYILLVTIMLLELQEEFIHYEVLEMFQMMHTKLQQLLTLDPIKDSLVINNKVRNLSYCYLSGCEAVRHINKANGSFILHFFFISTVIVTAIGNGVSFGTPNTTFLYRIYFFVLEISWLLFFILKIVSFVESCHAINKEVREIKFSLNRLLYRMTPAGRPLSLEMDIMFKETLLNAPQFSPLGVFTVDRSLIIAMASYITTYLVLSLDVKLR